ncbi:MAG: O-antigen ligase family protein [Planctomycetota bacterium]|nr:O-antigen ligase family protein [Planctomycetota bacterium]
MNRNAVPLVDRLAFGAIVVAAVTRVMIAFSSLPIFDMDPAIDASQFIGATPAESLRLDALAFGCASWLLLRRMLSQRAIGWNWILIAIACLPAIAIAFFHGARDAEQLWRGSTWVAGIAIALALLAQNDGHSAIFLRRMIVASLAGIAVVMCVRGVAQLTTEHISTVEFYMQNQDSFLKSQGWLPNSPQALSYERRLFQNEATGWFGFTNVFATVAAGTAVLMANVAIGRGVAAARSWMWFCAFLCAGLVIASGSKGGVGALALGLVMSVVARRWTHLTRPLLVALPLIAIGGIILRGMIGLDWGEQSLLFRWYYLVGGVKTILSAPWIGVGPAGFQSSFVQFRPVYCVEEVESAHGAFADWMIAFGLAGIGIVVLQLFLAWCSAPRVPNHSAMKDDDFRSVPVDGLIELSIATVVFSSIISIVFESPTLDSIGFAWRFAGIAAGSVTAWAVVKIMENGKASADRAVAIGLCGLAGVVMTHGQIDMVFWLPGSALWAWMVLGVSAWWNRSAFESDTTPIDSVGTMKEIRSTRIVLASFAFIFLAVALGIVFIVSPAVVRQDQLALQGAIRLNEEAQKNSSEKLAASRASAGEFLAQAAEIWPRRTAYAIRAAQQWQAAASCDPLPMEAAKWLRDGRESAQSVEEFGSSQFDARLLISTIAIREAEISSGSWGAARDALRKLLAINGRHSESWLRLAEVLKQLGDRPGALAALQTALESNETYLFDPLRQFSVDRRAWIEKEMLELK